MAIRFLDSRWTKNCWVKSCASAVQEVVEAGEYQNASESIASPRRG